MHPLFAEAGAEVFPQDIVHGVEDEVHALHGGIDDTELLDGLRESPLEELLIEVLDDGLLALEVVNLPDVGAHGVVEGLEGIILLIDGFGLEELNHQLHRAGDGVILDEGIFLE